MVNKTYMMVLIIASFCSISLCFAKEVNVVTGKIYNEIINTAEKEDWRMAYGDVSSDNKNIYQNYLFKTKQKYLLLRDEKARLAQFYLVLSRDGKKAAFWLSDDNEPKDDLYIVNSNGTGQAQILKVDTGAVIAWSPDGNKIAFVSDIIDRKVDPVASLYIVDINTKIVHKILSGGIDQLSYQAWPPDGNKIVYCYRGKIFIYDFKQQKSIFLTEGIDPHWSPTEEKILYYDTAKKSLNLLKVGNIQNLEGGIISEELVSSEELGPGDITTSFFWFPDGEYIFIGHLSPEEGEIGLPYVMKVESGEIEKLPDVSWYFSTWARP
jgi:WD40 repeat protein